MIFYFSGTGNTKWVAQQLATATGDSLYFIPDELKKDTLHYELKEDERLGFCFPTHGWQPPHIVREFIRRAVFQHSAPASDDQLQPSTYCYAVTTCGDNMGEAMTILNKELALHGLEAETQFSVIMPESYVCLPFMYTDTPEREREKKEKAKQDLHLFINKVKERQRCYSRLTKGLTPWTFIHVIGAYFNRFMITDRKFTVDVNACIHCGRCAKECPVGNIVFADIPLWKRGGDCTCCLSCYHHCPVHAINYGSITRKRGQYYFGHAQGMGKPV